MDLDVSYAGGGWVRVLSAELPGPLYVRVTDAGDGRLRVRDLFLQGDDEPVTAGHLRRLPVGAVEAAINDRGWTIRPRLDTSGPDLRTELGKTPWMRSVSTSRSTSWSVEIADQVGTTDGVDPPPLHRPPGRLSEDFFLAVARAYSRHASTPGARPGPELAKEAGVAVKTVHGWISEARKRGFLPPATKGRAG